MSAKAVSTACASEKWHILSGNAAISSSSSISIHNDLGSTEDTDTSQPHEDSKAATINRNLIRIFEVALQADIEVDLKDLIPGDYQERLAKAKADAVAPSKSLSNQETVIRENEDSDFELRAIDEAAASSHTPEWYGRGHTTTYLYDLRPELNPALSVAVLLQMQIMLSKQKRKLQYSETGAHQLNWRIR
ncbi:hypothetical protein GJ744_007566 [Endocarpon pusillum]|uniref:Uncharacterized protein n=1 Tax=Endocarpon pusillum TaxID=364733 RepID=A0A8H7E5Z1_9EURO|nr:hypothetical protein GJ744_007566 [Endocarpon pusillum]